MTNHAIATRIVLIGNFRGASDEGMRNISKSVASHLEKRFPILQVQTQETLFPTTIQQIGRFNPTIIHYLTGPTFRSLLVLKLYQKIFRGAVTISSAVRPFLTHAQSRLLSCFAPDLVLTQDPGWEKLFEHNGVMTCLLPNGVDAERFRPLSPTRKWQTRTLFELPRDKRLLLHVGHLRSNRNLEILRDVQKNSEWQVVIAASTALRTEISIAEKLRESGIRVIRSFIPDIERLYGCADAYIFPTKFPPINQLPSTYEQVGVIDMPLSVLEAMAVNLPVISTAVPALQRLFSEDPSFHWFDGTSEDCIAKLSRVDLVKVQNRQKIQDLDWTRIMDRLEQIYSNVLTMKYGGAGI